MQLWQIHVAEQMIIDDFKINPDKYENKRLSELEDDEDFDEEKSVEYTKVYYKKSLLPKMILVSLFSFPFPNSQLNLMPKCSHLVCTILQKTSVKELDLEAALAEREVTSYLDIYLWLHGYCPYSNLSQVNLCLISLRSSYDAVP